MAELAGGDHRVTIAGVVYKAQRATLNPKVSEGMTTNGESQVAGTTFAERIPCVAEARLTIVKASWDPAQNPFAGPYSVRVGGYVAIRVYPYKGDLTRYHDFPNVLIAEGTHEIDAERMQPFTLVGNTSGLFSLITT